MCPFVSISRVWDQLLRCRRHSLLCPTRWTCDGVVHVLDSFVVANSRHHSYRLGCNHAHHRLPCKSIECAKPSSKVTHVHVMLTPIHANFILRCPFMQRHRPTLFVSHETGGAPCKMLVRSLRMQLLHMTRVHVTLRGSVKSDKGEYS